MYWSSVLQSLHNLRSLRLTDCSQDGDQSDGGKGKRQGRKRRKRGQSRPGQDIDDEWKLMSDTLLTELRLPSLRKLHLANWKVTPQTFGDGMLTSFPQLRFLDLEKLDMISEESEAWPMALRMVVKRYGFIEVSVQELQQQGVRVEQTVNAMEVVEME